MRGRGVMLTDASNRELDEINALAQQARAERGELGSDGFELPGSAVLRCSPAMR